MEFVIDITKRQHAEAQLRVQGQLLETIVTHLPAAAALIRGSDLTFQMVNPRYQAISPDRPMIGKTVAEVWPEAMPQLVQRCQQVLETGEPFEAVDERHEIQRESNGPLETAYFSWSLRKVHLPDEAQPGLLLTLWETTARREVEMSLRETQIALAEREAVLRTVTNDARVGLVMVDENRKYLFANHTYADILGLPDSNILGKRVSDVLPTVYEAQIKPRLDRAFSGERVSYELRKPNHLNEERVYEVTYEPRTENRGRYVVVVIVDITERKKAQEILERTVLERTAALQEINNQMETFTYTIAHDLRAPLRAQQGFANALVEEYGPVLGETGRDYAQRIIASAIRLNDLVDDLLTYSRMDRTQLTYEKIDVRKVVCDICDEMTFQIHEANAKIHLGELHFKVCGHEPTFRTAVGNLIQNAIKFTRPNVPPEVNIRAEARGQFVRLWIEDNGIGISPEHHHQIFGVFHRLHRIGDYPGTGVGLAIVQKGVERMGGRVGVESQEGQGSRFWIELENVSDVQASRKY